MDTDATLKMFSISENDLLTLTLSHSQSHTHKNATDHQGQVVDYLDIQVQRKIEEQIRQTNVALNLETALEHIPESFGTVHMLFVEAKIHSLPIKVFVDSGAQATIISKKCAEQCGLSRLMDDRFKGIAMGVGQAAMLGRVHSAQMALGNAEKSVVLQCSFVVMDVEGLEIILGLDMLKRHQMVIDLSKDSLVVHDLHIPFLPDSQCPSISIRTK